MTNSISSRSLRLAIDLMELNKMNIETTYIKYCAAASIKNVVKEASDYIEKVTDLTITVSGRLFNGTMLCHL